MSDAYIQFDAPVDAGGDAGFHVLKHEHNSIAYLRYHSTPLRMFNASGIRHDVVAAIEKLGISHIFFENLTDGIVRSASINALKNAPIRNFGNKGARYYLNINEWKTENRLVINFTDNTISIGDIL